MARRLLGVQGLATTQVLHLLYSSERHRPRPPTSSAVLVNLGLVPLVTSEALQPSKRRDHFRFCRRLMTAKCFRQAIPVTTTGDAQSSCPFSIRWRERWPASIGLAVEGVRGHARPCANRPNPPPSSIFYLPSPTLRAFLYTEFSESWTPASLARTWTT